MRSSQRDHLWAFKRYADGASCFYLNAGFGSYPSYLKKISFDLIIFDWSFVGGRVSRSRFKDFARIIADLKYSKAVKICMPQDEFTSMDVLCDFITDFGVSHIFSVAPESEWGKIYRTVDKNRVQFVSVLTGYLDENLVRKWSAPTINATARPLDIVYRTVSTAIWGRFNLLKATIAEIFQKEAIVRGFNVDIRVGAEHFKMGDDWLKFLASSRFTLGVEGGSHILDWDGSILTAVTDYLRKKPDATYDELALTCIPVEREGEINVVAISPRHLEACMTRTVQILIEGEYNGILKPNVHYIPIKENFSNIDQVCARMSDESARLRMAERAFNDIVVSKKYTYRNLVETVLNETIGTSEADANTMFADRMWLSVNRGHTILGIIGLYLFSRARDLRNWLKSSGNR